MGWIVIFRKKMNLTLPDSPAVPRFMRAANLIGADGIPAQVWGNYGISAEQLANLMNRWRDRYGGGEGGGR
jgi:hypothetical protein